MDELIVGLGLSDAEIAVKLCVSPQTVTRWRKARKVPTPMARKALAKLARVPLTEITWERETPAPTPAVAR
jgi:DNA-binding transcriptional regulator YiaG